MTREEDEDGALLFNPDMDQVQLASKTGFYIWKLCAKECTVSDIINAFENDYDDVPEQEVILVVEDFIGYFNVFAIHYTSLFITLKKYHIPGKKSRTGKNPTFNG